MKKLKSRRKKRKIKHQLSLLITIISIMLLTFITTTVKAGTQDANLTRTKIDNVYAVAPLSDRTHLYNLEVYTVNNKISYCIEIGKSIETSIYNSTIDVSEQEKLTNLTAEQLNYIKTIINFGYGYQNHSDYKYYMAAQELIWEYINKIDITWTNVLDINGSKINIDTYKNEIINLVNSYNKEPNFETNITTKIGEKIILTDNNDSLKNYEIISQGNQTVKIEGNNLIIEINKNYIGTTKIKLARKNYYQHSSFLYYKDNSQQILSIGNTEEIIKNINLNIEGETLTTILLDRDNMENTPKGEATLEGAIYEIYDKNSNLVTTFTTDKKGINTINNLYHETYYIKQIKASKGYILNDEIYKIELSSTNNKIKLTQQVIKRKIEINKLYEVDNNYINEPNVIFKIYTSYNSIYTSFTTSKNGPKTVSLPYGTYIIKQITTTYGYNKINDISITIDENTEPIIKYTLKNEKLKTKLNIITKDKITNENITSSNIQYKIKDTKTNKYISYKDNNGTDNYIYLTNKNGQVSPLIELPYGEYQLEQTSPPPKYLENKEIIIFTINENTKYSNYNNELVLNIEFFNKPITGKINVITQEELFIPKENYYKKDFKLRPNIEIELYYEKELIDIYITNEQGKLQIENLKLGNYCLKDKNENLLECFELLNYNNKIEVIEKDIIITKKLKTTNIVINNLDNNNNPIKDKIIELYYENILINTSISNDEGIIKISEIPIGKYCLKEKEISLQYVKNEKETCFEITDTTKEKNITIINKLKQTELIPIPNTLSNSNNSNIIIFIILIIGGIIYKKKIIGNIIK